MTNIAGGLITLEYANAGLRYTDTNTTRDADITAYVQAATPVIESLVGPVLPVAKTIYGDGGKVGVLLPGPIANAAAVTAVRVNGSGWTGYFVNVDSGVVYAGPAWAGVRFPPGIRNVEIDVTLGYATVPQNVQLATRELVRYWVQIGRQAPAAGQLGQIPDSGADPLDPYAIPRRVRQLCGKGGGLA